MSGGGGRGDVFATSGLSRAGTAAAAIDAPPTPPLAANVVSVRHAQAVPSEGFFCSLLFS